jgi:cytochrome oxidase Cu insertion factor (SCO1/SenC/PrrC family)
MVMTENRAQPGYWPILIMIGVLSGVIVAGFLLFPKTSDERNSLLARLGTTNFGEFVVPAVSMTDLNLKTGDGRPWVFSEQKIKWRLIIPGAGKCIDECRELLHTTRQVHISLGKYSRRFERVYIALDDEIDSETERYMEEHPYLTVVHGKQDELEQLLEATNAPLFMEDAPLRAYLVDQEGLIMMSYTLANAGKELIEDIEHLMKYSPG